MATAPITTDQIKKQLVDAANNRLTISGLAVAMLMAGIKGKIGTYGRFIFLVGGAMTLWANFAKYRELAKMLQTMAFKSSEQAKVG